MAERTTSEVLSKLHRKINDQLPFINQSFKSASFNGNELVFTRNDNTTQKVQLSINTDDDDGSSDLNAIDLGTSNLEAALNKIISDYRSINGFYVTGDDLQGGYTKALINYWSETSVDAECIVYRANDVQHWGWGGDNWVCSYSLKSIQQTKLDANGFKTTVGDQDEAVLLDPDNNPVIMAGGNVHWFGNSLIKLQLGGSEDRPLYNNKSLALKSDIDGKLDANGFKTDVGPQDEAILLGPGNKNVIMAGQGISVGETQTDLFLYGKTLTYNNNNLVTEDQLDGKLDANGFETAIEDGAEQLLNSKGKIIVQTNIDDSWMDVGNHDTDLYLYGSGDHPYYNDNYLALKSDIITVQITDLRK